MVENSIRTRNFLRTARLTANPKQCMSISTLCYSSEGIPKSDFQRKPRPPFDRQTHMSSKFTILTVFWFPLSKRLIQLSLLWGYKQRQYDFTVGIISQCEITRFGITFQWKHSVSKINICKIIILITDWNEFLCFELTSKSKLHQLVFS